LVGWLGWLGFWGKIEAFWRNPAYSAIFFASIKLRFGWFGLVWAELCSSLDLINIYSLYRYAHARILFKYSVSTLFAMLTIVSTARIFVALILLAHSLSLVISLSHRVHSHIRCTHCSCTLLYLFPIHVHSICIRCAHRIRVPERNRVYMTCET
jgi:hypothetical protein